MLTQINRDPFSRADLVREALPMTPRRSCSWCGGRPGRFKYGWWADDRPGPEWARGVFCSVDCYRAYHDERKP
jgi:hypothetical protein